MYSRLGVFASLALVAQSILLPPSIENLGDDNAVETLSVNPFKQAISLECPGCAVASKEGDALTWTENAGTSFLLDFEVGQDEETLNIDGVQLYPPSFDNFATPFYVRQVQPGAESKNALRLRVTGYSFHYNSAETITEAGAELLPMTFKITSVESKTVAPPPLTIYLLKDVNGRLMIANFQQSAKAEESSPTEQNEDKECKDWPLLCKWKSILADKFHGAKGMGKGCHRHKGGKFNPMEHPGMHGKPPHKFRPGDHHPHHSKHHGYGHHRHHHNRFQRFLHRAFFTILIPILIGIFAGTLTYLIGMALGCAIAVVVSKIRGRGPYERIALEDEDEAEEGSSDSDKEVYLPVYDAPPVYEEATAEKEVVESH